MSRILSVWLIFSVLSVAFGQQASSPKRPTDLQVRPAVFEVTADVINEDLEPFTFTAPAFGNTLQRTGKGGFEPATFRTKFNATRNHPDRIYNAQAISHFDSYASGYLDGAEVRVFRLINGELKIVRTDTVAASPIEEWNFGNGRKVIDTSNTTSQFKWAEWSRPGATRWFTVVAVDTAGNVSAPADPVRVQRPVAEKNAQAKSPRKNFQARGGDKTPPPAPENFQATVQDNGVITFSWDPVQAEDLAGYRIGRTDADPASHRGTYLELAETASGPEEHIRKDDLIFVSESMIDFSTDWLSHRLANLHRIVRSYLPDGIPNGFDPRKTPGKTWRLAPHSEDTPVKDPGEVYLEMTLREGDTELVGKSGIPDISTTAQDYYPVPTDGAEYVMEVWMKADRADRAPVTFTWDGDNRVGGFVGEHPLQLTTEWKKYEVRFTGQSTDQGHHAYFVLKTRGPGTFSFDNYRVYRADTPYLDYKPYQYEQLKESGMMAFRTHGPIKTGTTTYSMRQFLGEAGEAEGVAKGNTLPQMLRAIRKMDMHPWLQIEFHMNDQEWLNFAEYMAAPFDPAVDTQESKPYAYLRVQQGQAAPWIDEFERIYFEIGNETWNGLFRPWVFTDMTDADTGKRYRRGEVYGKFHDRVVGVLRSSPYWNDDIDEKFRHVLGGWAIGSYSREAANASETADYITIAAYNGGWDEGEGTPRPEPASYFNVLSQVNQTVIPRAVEYAKLADELRAQGKEIRLGTYEAGPGYALNGLNNARVTKEQAQEQELVMKSKLAGTATLDSFLTRAYYDFDLQNFFTYTEGDLWKSHAKKHRGGQPHASYLPMELFNRYGTGDMLLTHTRSVTTVDTAKFRRRKPIDNQPLAAVYATREDDRVSLFCISRRVPNYPVEGDPGYTPFGVQLPFTSAASITLFRMTGSPTDNNIHSETVMVEEIPIDPKTLGADGRFVVNQHTGGTAQGLPPAETYLYVFEGTDIQEGQTLPLEDVIRQPVTFAP
jgi:hypothetical protein